MKYSQLAGVLSISLSVASCASFQSISIPPERIVQTGYSLVPLNEKGWRFGPRNPVHLVLGKVSDNPDESLVINSTIVKIRPYKTKDEFVQLVRESQADDTDERFENKQFEVTGYDEKGTDCAKSYAISEDKTASRRSGNTGTMIIELLSLTCAHPKNKRYAVYVGYSHRYYPGHKDDAFAEKAWIVMNSLEFTDP